MAINLRSMITRLSSWSRAEIATTLLRTFIARGISMLGSFGFVVVVGRMYGTSGVGIFALGNSLLIAAAIVSRYGMDHAVTRFVGRDLQSQHVPTYLRHACAKAALLSVIAAGLLFATRALWGQWFNAPELPIVLVGYAIATPAFTLAFIIAGFMRAVRKPATSCLFQNGAIGWVAALLMLPLNQLWPSAGIVTVGVAYAVAAWVILGLGIWCCGQWLGHSYQPVAEETSQPEFYAFNQSSSAFFVHSLYNLISRVFPIWIAGYFLVGSAVGLFQAAQQIAMLISVILVVINAIFIARIATFFRQGDRAALFSNVRSCMLLGLALGAGPTMILLFAPSFVLGLIGPEFLEAQNLLRMLAVAQLVNVTFGCTTFLLDIAGYETHVRNISLVSGIGVVAMLLILTPIWGVPAVAFGVAIGFVTKNLVSLYFVRTKLEM